MADAVLCDYCGRPITDEELATEGATVWSFTPDSEAGPEVSEFRHILCEQKRLLQRRLGVPLEFGSGWVPLVTRLVDAIDAIGLPYGVEQVKEKFGGLRFYWHTRWLDDGESLPTNSDQMHTQIEALIDAAEEESFRTCEICGKPGTRHTDGWITVRCDQH